MTTTFTEPCEFQGRRASLRCLFGGISALLAYIPVCMQSGYALVPHLLDGCGNIPYCGIRIHPTFKRGGLSAMHSGKPCGKHFNACANGALNIMKRHLQIPLLQAGEMEVAGFMAPRRISSERMQAV